MSSSSSSSSPSCPTKMITLKSSDGETFQIEKNTALQSKTLENMIDENCASNPAQAANFLEIPTLLDLATGVVADMIKGKTPDEGRKIFNITDTFSPEEEEEVCRANPWAFE